MASPLDPFIEPFQSDPLTGSVLLLITVAFLLVPEALLAYFYVRPVLGRRLRKDQQKSVKAGEWDEVFERVTGPLKEELAELKELIQGDEIQEKIVLVETKLTELDVALGAHLTALNESIQALPEHMKLSAQGGQGVEMREIYKAATAAEEDAVDAYVADLDPTERIAARLDSMEPSEEYTKKHPNGAMIIRGVRDLIVDQVRQRRGDVITMKQVGGKGKFPTVYGGR